MVQYRLVSKVTGDVTAGTTSTRRLAFEECAGYILTVLPFHWQVILTRSDVGFDVYRVKCFPKRKKDKTVYEKIFEASIS